MKRITLLVVCMLVLGIAITSCDLLIPSSSGSQDLEGTRVAIAIQQTSMAMEQTRIVQDQPPTAEPEVQLQPTYTLYPTYTSEAVVEQPTVQEPTQVIEQPTVAEPEPSLSFEEWLKDAKILLYDDMYGMGESRVIQNAVDGLGLGRNTTDVRDAMGHLLSQMNSATQWDLIIIGAESRTNVSGEYFDVMADQIDRGTSIVIEIWYIDNVSQGRIQPIMQRCGIAFHRDWWRAWDSNLNDYLVYLLIPENPMFSEPNTISMLIPYDTLWIGDVGDTVKINPGSDALLLAGNQPKEYSSYGLITECIDGRLIWQTFSTHDYKNQEMINLWQNYIHNALKARYAYLYE